MPFIRYLLTNTTREIPNFIHYLTVLIILFPKKYSANRKLLKQDFLNALIRIRHGSNSFDKIKGTTVDK